MFMSPRRAPLSERAERTFERCLRSLSALWIFTLSAHLCVASPVTPLLERLSIDYQQGAGVAGAREVEAARAARALSPSRWQSWGLNAQGQAPQSANAEAGEQQLTLTLTLALGGGPQAQSQTVCDQEGARHAKGCAQGGRHQGAAVRLWVRC